MNSAIIKINRRFNSYGVSALEIFAKHRENRFANCQSINFKMSKYMIENLLFLGFRLNNVPMYVQTKLNGNTCY